MGRPLDATSGWELPRLLWVAVPLAVAVSAPLTRALWPEVYAEYLASEMGVIENLTVVFLLCAIWVGVRTLRRVGVAKAPFLGAWIGLVVLGCVYFAGEEISWGYHYAKKLGLEDWFPEAWRNRNEQDEPNLHNDSHPVLRWLFDQGPRGLLTAGAFLGGAVLPLLARRRGRPFGGRTLGWYLPTYCCVPVGLLAALVTLPKTVARWAEKLGAGEIDVRSFRMGETKECLLALFLLIYLASIRARLKPRP